MNGNSYFSSKVVSEIYKQNYFHDNPVDRIDIFSLDRLEEIVSFNAIPFSSNDSHAIKFLSNTKDSFVINSLYALITTVSGKKYFFLFPGYFKTLFLSGNNKALEEYIKIYFQEIEKWEVKKISFYPFNLKNRKEIERYLLNLIKSTKRKLNNRTKELIRRS